MHIFDAFKARFVALSVATAIAVVPSPASAGTKSGTMTTTVTVDPSCRMTVSGLSFGNANLFSGVVDATTTINLTCGPAVNYSVAIDNGQYYNGQRRMYGGPGFLGFGEYVSYQLYRNAARTQTWGATAATMATGTTPASGKVALTVYGRVPNSLVFARPYVDTVTVTVNF